MKRGRRKKEHKTLRESLKTLFLFSKYGWPRSSAWSEHWTLNPGVAGSSPVGAVFNMGIRIDFDGYNGRYNHMCGDLVTHDFWELFGITREEDFYDLTEFDVMPVIGAAVDAMRKLIEKNELIVIAARPVFYREKTLKFFDKIIFTNQYGKDWEEVLKEQDGNGI